MYTLTREAQQRLDAKAEEQGLPGLLLMERAGSAVARHILALCPRETPVFIFCGQGKNAGDAYVLARVLLAADYQVRLWEIAPDRAKAAELAGSESGSMRRALRAMGLEPKPLPQEDYSLNAFFSDLNKIGSVFLVDALIGTGYQSSRLLAGLWSKVTQALNTLQKNPAVTLLSIDIPTGVDANSGRVDAAAIQADRTVSFEYPKTGMISYPGRGQCGEIVLEGLGLSPDFLSSFWQNERQYVSWVQSEDFSSDLPERDATAYKNQFGHVLLICGSRGMAGAAILAARAALQSGVGLVSALVAEDIYAACLTALHSVMWRPYSRDASDFEVGLTELMKGKAALRFGTGTSQMPKWQLKAVLKAAERFPAPVLLDAEALNYLAENADYAVDFFANRVSETILTPHSGEFKRLAPDLNEKAEGRLELARILADRVKAYVILKGAATIVATPEGKLAVNSSGNSGMAKAGSGDVLAGMLLALCARPGTEIERDIQLGVFAHGLAADLQKNAAGVYSVCAESILERIPEALDVIRGIGPQCVLRKDS